jgi:hypothetical protein
MLTFSLLSVAFAAAHNPAHGATFSEPAAPVALKQLHQLVPGSTEWAEQATGVFLGRMQDGSSVRVLAGAGMELRKQELRERLADLNHSPSKLSGDYNWMRQELDALERTPAAQMKAMQLDHFNASICGLTHYTMGSFSADLLVLPFGNFWMTGASTFFHLSQFGGINPDAMVAYGWVSLGVSSTTGSAGQFDNYSTVRGSPPITGSWAVPDTMPCELQIEATVSVGCTALSPTPYSYFHVSRWQSCEGVVAGSPINVR